MKKTFSLIVFLMAGAILLVACSNNKNDDSQEPAENNKPEVDTDEKQEDESGNDGEEEYGDQLDLRMGDTGTFETSIGIFEVTVNEAELIGAEKEYDGQEVRSDDLLKIELTVKNISDEAYSLDDFLGTIVVTDNLEGGGDVLYGKSVFDSLDDISGDLEPGEAKTGERIIEVYESDEYYLQRRSGNTAAGGTNEVIITIPADEEK